METKKQKIIKILKRIGMGLSIGFNIVFLLAIIIGSTANKKQVNCSLAESDNVVEKLDIKQDNKRYVSYNDESYTITLTADEINNYTWENLYNYFNSFNNTTIFGTLNYGTYSSSIQIAFTPTWSGIFCDIGTYYLVYSFNESDYSIFNAYYNSSVAIEIVDNTEFVISSEYYNDIKSAIELDISNNNKTITDGIFETLNEGVTAFVGSIGSGIVAMTSVFYDSANSQLTTIGLLSVIVVSVTLSYFLLRLLFGLIRMRG